MKDVFSRHKSNSPSHFPFIKHIIWPTKAKGRMTQSLRKFIIPFTTILVLSSLIFNSTVNLKTENENERSGKRSKKLESLDPNTKSHVQVCRAILGRDQPFSGSVESENNENSKVTVTIQEHVEVCMEFNRITESLVQIFTSSYLAYQGSANGINVKYRHDCRRNIYGEVDAVMLQQVLPEEFVIPEDDEHLSWESLRNLCVNVLNDDSINPISSAVNVFVSFDTGSSKDMYENLTIEKVLSNQEIWQTEIISNKRKTIMEHALSFIQINMKETIDNQRINEYMSDRQKRSVQTGIHQFFSTDLHQNDSGSYTYQFSQQKNTASIYIPCSDIFCNDVLLLPYYIYPSYIPSSVQNLNVVLQKGCLEKNPNCSELGKDLIQFLKELYPLMNIGLLAHNPSSLELMQLLIESEYVLCAPGYGEVCLFPSITRSFYPVKDREVSTSRIMVFEQNTNLQRQHETGIETDMSSLSSSVKYLSYKLLDQIYSIPLPQSYTFLSSLPNIGHMFSTLRLPPPTASGECRHIRGRIGVWQKDMNYAIVAQYDKPIRHYSGQTDIHYRRAYKKGEVDLEYRPSITYKWHDTAVVHSTDPQINSCDVNLVTLNNLCSTLQSLDIRRIFFLGDSLTLQHTLSLWKLLNQPNGPTIPKSLEPNFKHQIDCPNLSTTNGKPFFFIFEFVRNDELIQNKKEVSMQNGIENCNQFCYPWEDKYKMHPNMRTLMIVNSGAHFKNTDHYENALDNFVSKMDEIFDAAPDGKKGDIVMFRTSVPGHRRCDRSGLIPFLHFGQYQDSVSGENATEDNFGWNNFFEYNSYATRLFDSRRFNNLKNTIVSEGSNLGNVFEILDVLPMTILRPDGHIGDEFKPDNIPTRDCLHYALPGPLDWWNHLLLSNLIDIANAELMIA